MEFRSGFLNDFNLTVQNRLGIGITMLFEGS
jgi:hypothetical protein